ncbi:pentapeptide repeat-containing protein [Streptomyces sp. WAC06614]|uniref:pentapeptide repeat-containing protein n=1 Tax=Streptomyces sp. WAC06614 TaxID=2487416 RepID=UPI000F776502|nr:hypothetical protein EF918_22735 [Streptomyces sp. WAC06614]
MNTTPHHVGLRRGADFRGADFQGADFRAADFRATVTLPQGARGAHAESWGAWCLPGAWAMSCRVRRVCPACFRPGCALCSPCAPSGQGLGAGDRHGSGALRALEVAHDGLARGVGPVGPVGRVETGGHARPWGGRGRVGGIPAGEDSGCA